MRKVMMGIYEDEDLAGSGDSGSPLNFNLFSRRDIESSS